MEVGRGGWSWWSVVMIGCGSCSWWWARCIDGCHCHRDGWSWCMNGRGGCAEVIMMMVVVLVLGVIFVVVIVSLKMWRWLVARSDVRLIPIEE